MSITLRWTLISKRSKVAVPSPQGDFLVVTLRRFVGRGIGPLIVIPARSTISLINCVTSFIGVISMLLNFILTLDMTCLEKVDLKRFALQIFNPRNGIASNKKIPVGFFDLHFQGNFR